MTSTRSPRRPRPRTPHLLFPELPHSSRARSPPCLLTWQTKTIDFSEDGTVGGKHSQVVIPTKENKQPKSRLIIKIPPTLGSQARRAIYLDIFEADTRKMKCLEYQLDRLVGYAFATFALRLSECLGESGQATPLVLGACAEWRPGVDGGLLVDRLRAGARRRADADDGELFQSLVVFLMQRHGHDVDSMDSDVDSEAFN